MFSLNCIEMKKERPDKIDSDIFFDINDFIRRNMPRLIKKTLIKSGKAMVEKITSAGNKAARNEAINEIFSLLVINLPILYVRIILIIENTKGKTIVAVSFIPKSLNDKAYKNISLIRSGKMG